MPIELRTATPADAPDIAAVHAEGWRWGYRDLLPHALLGAVDGDGGVERWRRALEDGATTVWVARGEDETLGFLAGGAPRIDAHAPALERYLEIHAIYQRERAARSGVARALLSRALADFRARGADGVFLWVLSTNLRARQFYEAAGLRADGVTKVETLDGVDLPHARYALVLA